MFSNLLNLKNLGRGLAGGATAITYAEFAKKLSEKNLQRELANKTAEVEALRDNALQGGQGVLEENTKYKLTSESLDVREFIADSKKHAESLAKSVQEGKSLEIQEYYYQMYKKSIEKADKAAESIQEVLSNSKIKLISEIEKLITEFKEYVTTLNLEQLSHLITITSTFFILFCFFNVIVIMFGDKLIDFFNLETK